MKTSAQLSASLIACSVLWCGAASASAGGLIQPRLPAPGLPLATHSCPATCLPGTALPVTAVFNYSGVLNSFAWYPSLPSGWSIGLIKGPGQPVVDASGAIVFTGPIPPSPIQLTYYVQVPAEASGTNFLRDRVAYRVSVAPHVGELPEVWASPDPLVVTVQPPHPPLLPDWTVVWQNSSGAAALWEMAGTQIQSVLGLSTPFADPEWRIASARDVNGDGHVELRWQHADGWLATACVEGANCTAVSYLNPAKVAPGYRMAASADLNGDGQAEILWQHTNGAVWVWYMNGTNRVASAFVGATNSNPGWNLVGTGRFGGPGGVDLLWQNENGSLAAWQLGKGLTIVGMIPLNPPQVDANWRVAGTHDLNRDGHTEIIWQHSSGLVIYWIMNGTTRIDGGLLNLDPVVGDWHIVGPR